PETVRFVPVDLERPTLWESLRTAGFDDAKPVFFNMLGVVPYLARETVLATLSAVAGLTGGTEVVFDYPNPNEELPAEQRAERELSAEGAAAIGEPWLSYFATDELHDRLRAAGFATIEDRGPDALVARYLGRPARDARPAGGHVVRAALGPG
ncbi:MAG: class I SAM-dependent methyltransferase, partial [Nocardioidaceae bacterium]